MVSAVVVNMVDRQEDRLSLPTAGASTAIVSKRVEALRETPGILLGSLALGVPCIPLGIPPSLTLPAWPAVARCLGPSARASNALHFLAPNTMTRMTPNERHFGPAR